MALQPGVLAVTYVHGSLIENLFRKKELPVEARQEIHDKYLEFRARFPTASTAEQVELLNAYRFYVRDNEIKYKDHGLGNKTKYYSSVLEEMLTLVAETHVVSEIRRLGLHTERLGLGRYSCAIRISASIRGRLHTEMKDVDFALVLQLEENEAVTPLVGYEVKKYLDKTMYATVLNTVTQLGAFRPKTFYGCVAEDEGRDDAVASNSQLFDRESLLTGKKRNGSALHPVVALEFERFKTTLLYKLTRALEYLAEEVENDRLKEAPLADVNQLDLLLDPQSASVTVVALPLSEIDTLSESDSTELPDAMTLPLDDLDPEQR